MNPVLAKLRIPVALTVALAVGAWACGIVQVRPTSAQTASSPRPTIAPLPPGPPSPAGFADTVKRIYAESVSYAGLPGLGPSAQPGPTAAPMSVDAFNQLVGTLTPDQLNKLYDYKPDAWPRVDATLGAYTTKAPPPAVAAQIGQAYAEAAKPAPAASQPALAPGGADYVPPEPEAFGAANCPTTDLGGEDGYDLLFGFDEAHDIAAIPAQPFFASLGQGYEAAVIALLAVAFALEIPAMTTELLISLSTFCSTTNAENEKEVMDHNVVNLDNTSIAMLALDNQVQALGGQVNQLLDTRTQAVVSKLNTAQAALDHAQQQDIEESLQGGGDSAIASYELPASLGGYLDSTPIGVQVIVTNAMASLQKANQPVNPTATSSLASANSALAAGQYKQAFGYYQSAYQALTK